MGWKAASKRGFAGRVTVLLLTMVTMLVVVLVAVVLVAAVGDGIRRL
jgi:phosphotransferase system  glucose/maltose/N-acetylglucosamine-specific IIC component